MDSGIKFGGRSRQTRALCGEPCPIVRQTGSSNLEHAIDLGRGHAADGHSGPDEDFGIERVSNRGLVDFDCFSDRLQRSSIEQLYGDGGGAEVLLHANSDQAGDDMMDLSEGEPRLADYHIGEIAGRAPTAIQRLAHALLMNDQGRDDASHKFEHSLSGLERIVEQRQVAHGLVAGALRPESGERSGEPCYRPSRGLLHSLEPVGVLLLREHAAGSTVGIV